MTSLVKDADANDVFDFRCDSLRTERNMYNYVGIINIVYTNTYVCHT